MVSSIARRTCLLALTTGLLAASRRPWRNPRKLSRNG